MQTWIIDVQSGFPQIYTEYTFSTEQFASGGWGTMNTCTSKHIDNWCCCSTAQLALSLPCIFTAHIKYTKTKCPFQRQQGDDAVQPSPPKSQTKVHPCCHGQNMPFCHKQTDAVVMYSAALQLQSKHKGHLLIIDGKLTSCAVLGQRLTTSWSYHSLSICSSMNTLNGVFKYLCWNNFVLKQCPYNTSPRKCHSWIRVVINANK